MCAREGQGVDSVCVCMSCFGVFLFVCMVELLCDLVYQHGTFVFLLQELLNHYVKVQGQVISQVLLLSTRIHATPYDRLL